MAHLLFSWLYLLVFACIGFGTAEAWGADFDCGPYSFTYKVTDLQGQRSGKGIRCVRFSSGHRDGDTPRFAWYGEGEWNGAKYRNLGHAIGKGVQATGYAADFAGNGEAGANEFQGNLEVYPSAGDLPSKIIIKGAWSEVWDLVPQGQPSGYVSALPRVRNCGPFMKQYKVVDASTPARPSDAVRCVLDDGRETYLKFITWFGDGTWDRAHHYAHVGTWDSNGHHAADICEPSKYNTCGYTPSGSLKLLQNERGWITASGAWDEVWVSEG